jgi:hypothetical protein
VKVHYYVDKSPPFVPILSQMNSIHLILSHFIKIHYNIIPYTVISSLLADSYLAVLQCHPKKRIHHLLFLGRSIKIFLVGLRAIPLDVQGVEEKKEAAPFTVFLQRK